MHIFISHASEDKVDRVKPIVEALLMEGEPVWIDRPGLGANNFGFSAKFISSNPIDFLGSGTPYSDSLKAALRTSGAVLGCLSRALLGQRDVIIGELTVASTLEKLTTCIVDDLNFGELPELTLGLLDAGRLQAPQIDTAALRRAVDRRRSTGCKVSELPTDERQSWETLLSLISSVNKKRIEPRRMRPVDVERLRPLIASTTVGPMLEINEIPQGLWQTLADHIDTRERANLLIQQANTLLTEVERGHPELPGFLIRRGALPAIGTLSGDDYWTRVLSLAGMKSRKTVSALLNVPVAEWAFDQSSLTQHRNAFVAALAGRSVH